MKNQKPIYWDRLFLVVFGNLMIAMAIIVGIEDRSIPSALFGLNIGAICHWLFWTDRRFIIKFE